MNTKTTRRLVQLAFVILTLVAVFVVGGDAERWCPFGGVEALYSYATVGNMTCSLGVSNFFILGAVLVMALLMRRAFCGYVCPIGAISEFLQAGASRLGIRPLRVPTNLDRVLRMLKYPLLVVILYITYKSGELLFRGFDPCYALISRHGKDITFWAYVVSGLIVLGSLFILVPFCRWLCPLAAVFTPFSRFGLARVQRHADTCIDCGICQRVCPMNIPVDKVQQVTASRCTSCLDCVAACPKTRDGALSWGPPRFIGGSWTQAGLLVVVLACIGGAVAATVAFPLPSFISARGEPPANVETVDLQVRGVSCRGTSEALVDWLDRDDLYAIDGYLKIETWPSKDVARVRITFDPAQTTAPEIKRAIAAPYLDLLEGTIRESQFELQGYTPSVDDL